MTAIWGWVLRNPVDAALGAAAVLFLAAAGVQTVRLAHAEAEVADRDRDRAELHAELTRQANAGLLAQQTRTQTQQAAVDAARKDLDAARREIRSQAQRLARLQHDNAGLRQQLDDYAGGPAAGGDTLGACHARARALAGLLAEGAEIVREGVELAGASAAAETERAAEVRACVAGWPR